MAKIVLTRRAVKDLEGLDDQTRKRILEKLKAYGQDPLQHSIKLAVPKLGTYRYRIGDYRVIFDLEDDTVIVLRVGNRRDIYS